MRFINVIMLIIVSVALTIGYVINENHGAKRQNHRDEIDSLLKKLSPVSTKEGDRVVMTTPSVETQQDAHDWLLRIANETDESRSEVVVALLRVLEDPLSREVSPIAYEWTMAVKVLGELRATESINALIKNLGQTGQHGVIISISYRPVALALARIGEPAVPQLVEGLSSSDEAIRQDAMLTLVNIGRPALGKVQEALDQGDARTRGGAALTLAWIGGEDARISIERAIANEKDQEVLKELKDALREMQGV